MLRRTIIPALVMFLIVAATSQNLFAQRTVRLSSTPSAFRFFYKKFVKAVNRGVGTEIAAMTNFPFQYGFDAGDEGVWTRNQFLKNYGNIFMPQPIVFKRRDPQFTVEAGTYTLYDSSDASAFTFKKGGSSYKLISYVVEP